MTLFVCNCMHPKVIHSWSLLQGFSVISWIRHYQAELWCINSTDVSKVWLTPFPQSAQARKDAELHINWGRLFYVEWWWTWPFLTFHQPHAKQCYLTMSLNPPIFVTPSPTHLCCTLARPSPPIRPIFRPTRDIQSWAQLADVAGSM